MGAHHEQSRSDRDSYVVINTANIVAGSEGNFEKVPSSSMNLYGTAYSYESIMHYGPKVNVIFIYYIYEHVIYDPLDSTLGINPKLYLWTKKTTHIRLPVDCHMECLK